MMTNIESALASAINNYPKIPLIIAYSGGVDSQVLLHALAKLKHAKKILNKVTVCHVNHGLSVNASKWQAFAKQECQRLNLTFVACQVNLQLQAQQSLEALAREARYQALHSLDHEQSIILTGHHRDDQAETFILALKRGAGLKGLSAMACETKRDKDIIMRPLLDISRAEIVSWANQQRLDWIEDESNSDTRFDRNFIRQTIMPLLSDRWPSIAQSITRSSSHCLEGQQLLNELAEQDLVKSQLSEQCLSVDELSKLSLARFNNLVRFFIAKHNHLMPSTEQLAQVRTQLLAKGDKNPAVKVANNYLRRYKDALYLTANFSDITHWHTEVDCCYEEKKFNSSKCIKLPDGLGKLTFANEQFTKLSNLNSSASYRIILPSTLQKVTVRFSHTNPTCLPDYRNHSRSLKKVLQELNIPPWQRKRIPFIYYDDVLVAAIGHFVCQAYLASEHEPSFIVTWKK